MIASPGDVASERAIIRDVTYEWNAVHSKSKSIVLLPIGWETHASPEMRSSAQSVINKQVLDKCDLLVGEFWTQSGELLLLDALQRSLENPIAAMCVVVDAINDQALAFYERYDFIRFQDLKRRLFLPMKTIEKIF